MCALLLCALIIWVYTASELCQPVDQPAQLHTKRCLELQDNAASCMTFVGAASMSARHIIVVKHMLICLVFYNASWSCSFCFTSLEGRFIISWNACFFLMTAVCPFSALFYGLCLLLKTFIVYLLIALFLLIVHVYWFSVGVYCWIFVNIVEYFH